MDRELRLLLAEMRVLWGTDSRGRYEPPPLCALAASGNRYRLAVRPDLDPGLRSRLRRVLVAAARGAPAPGLRQALAPAVPLLAAAGIAAGIQGGPSFLVEAEPAADLTGADLVETEPGADLTAGRSIVRSAGAAGLSRLAGCQRPASWQAGEWAELLAGRLGPWAMLVQDDQVLSICHTPRESPEGAEAGVWTSPVFRGHRYARVTTAAWAGLLRERDDRPLFYSTSEANAASRRVAAGLGLAGLGWIWHLQAPDH
jgi:hypothetical protein